MGRTALQPLSARQYAASFRPKWKLSGGLREATPWWIDSLNESVPRRASAVDRPPIVVYTDASGEGHIACVLYIDGARTTAHTHDPPRFKALVEGVFESGLLAGAFPLAMAAALAPCRPVRLCCDNRGSMGTVIRGSRRTKIGRTIGIIFWGGGSLFRYAGLG